MRGNIRDKDAKQQIVAPLSIDGTKITHTDVDILIDYKDKFWIVGEIKREGVLVSFGQQLALDRLVRDLSVTKPTLFFIADHNTPLEEVIPTEALLVRGSKLTVKELCEKFILSKNFGIQ